MFGASSELASVMEFGFKKDSVQYIVGERAQRVRRAGTAKRRSRRTYTHVWHPPSTLIDFRFNYHSPLRSDFDADLETERFPRTELRNNGLNNRTLVNARFGLLQIWRH